MNIIKTISITLASGVVLFFTVFLSIDSPFLRTETSIPSGFPTMSPTNFTMPTPLPTELLYEDFSIRYSGFFGTTATRSLPTQSPF